MKKTIALFVTLLISLQFIGLVEATKPAPDFDGDGVPDMIFNTDKVEYQRKVDFYYKPKYVHKDEIDYYKPKDYKANYKQGYDIRHDVIYEVYPGGPGWQPYDAEGDVAVPPKPQEWIHPVNGYGWIVYEGKRIDDPGLSSLSILIKTEEGTANTYDFWVHELDAEKGVAQGTIQVTDHLTGKSHEEDVRFVRGDELELEGGIEFEVDIQAPPHGQAPNPNMCGYVGLTLTCKNNECKAQTNQAALTQHDQHYNTGKPKQCVTYTNPVKPTEPSLEEFEYTSEMKNILNHKVIFIALDKSQARDIVAYSQATQEIIDRGGITSYIRTYLLQELKPYVPQLYHRGGANIFAMVDVARNKGIILVGNNVGEDLERAIDVIVKVFQNNGIDFVHVVNAGAIWHINPLDVIGSEQPIQVETPPTSYPITEGGQLTTYFDYIIPEGARWTFKLQRKVNDGETTEVWEIENLGIRGKKTKLDIDIYSEYFPDNYETTFTGTIGETMTFESGTQVKIQEINPFEGDESVIVRVSCQACQAFPGGYIDPQGTFIEPAQTDKERSLREEIRMLKERQAKLEREQQKQGGLIQKILNFLGRLFGGA